MYVSLLFRLADHVCKLQEFWEIHATIVVVIDAAGQEIEIVAVNALVHHLHHSPHTSDIQAPAPLVVQLRKDIPILANLLFLEA